MSHAIDAPARGSGRDHILDCARRLFAERGFDGVSVADIARETATSKANIFHHFGSKEGLYIAVIERVVARLPDEAGLFAGQPDVVAGFGEHAAAELAEATKDETGVRLILKEIISAGPERGRLLAEEIFARRFSDLVARIREQQAEGTFRADFDPVLAAHVLRSASAFFVLGRNVMRHMPGVAFADDPERYAREATALIMRGLLARDEHGKD